MEIIIPVDVIIVGPEVAQGLWDQLVPPGREDARVCQARWGLRDRRGNLEYRDILERRAQQEQQEPLVRQGSRVRLE